MNAIKKTTGLTGLAVAKNPAHTLTLLYGKILRALQKVPADAAYRKHTEQLISQRAAIVNSAKSTSEIEEKINSGQAEELIVQAENELRLVRNFAYSKPWEPLSTSAPKGQWTWPPAKTTN